MGVFQVGDRVKFLYKEGGGVIRKQLGRELYLVKSEEGFEIEVSEEEIVLVKPISSSAAQSSSPSTKGGQQSPLRKPERSSSPPEREKMALQEKRREESEVSKNTNSQSQFSGQNALKEGIYFGLRETIIANVFHLLLINHTPDSLLFVVGEKKGERISLVHHGKLKPWQGVRVTSVSKEELPFQLLFQCIAVPPSERFQPMEPAVQELSVSLSSNPQFTPYVSAPLHLKKVKVNWKPLTSIGFPTHKKESALKPSEPFSETLSPLSHEVSPGRLVVDLHIESLRKRDYYQLKKEEILSIQLEAVERVIGEAVQKQVPEVIFIHGIGQSVLKRELQARLREHPFVQNMEVLIGPPYQGGATLVRLLL